MRACDHARGTAAAAYPAPLHLPRLSPLSVSPLSLPLHHTHTRFSRSSGPSYNYYAAPPLVGGYGYGFSPFGFSPFGYGFGGPALVVGGGGGLFFNLLFFGMVASFILSAFRGGKRNVDSEDDEEDDRFY